MTRKAYTLDLQSDVLVRDELRLEPHEPDVLHQKAMIVGNAARLIVGEYEYTAVSRCDRLRDRKAESKLPP